MYQSSTPVLLLLILPAGKARRTQKFFACFPAPELRSAAKKEAARQIAAIYIFPGEQSSPHIKVLCFFLSRKKPYPP